MFIFHTADVVWDEIEVCIDRLETVDELMTSLSTAMNECRREEEGTLLTVVFTGQGSLSPYLRDEKRVEEIFHILASSEERKDFVYAMKWKNETVSFAEIERLKAENHFIGSVLKELEAFSNMDGVLRTIWTSPVARNSIESLQKKRRKRFKRKQKILF